MKHRKFLLAKNAFDPQNKMRFFQGKFPNAGAFCQFTGQVRPQDRNGTRVEALKLSHFPGVTEREALAFLEKISAQSDLLACVAWHRIGKIKAGETIVWVAAASEHRRAAFIACDRIMDYLKSEAFFWKKEIYVNGQEKWIEPRAADYEAAKRWL